MTIFGWDMSHFDAPSIGSAIGEGICFLTHKAGGDRDDPELGAWWAGVRGLDPGRVLLGAYWVLRPPVDAAGEASAFLRRLDAECPGWRGRPFLLQLDCEKWNGDPSTVPSKSQIAAVCGQLVKAMPKLRPVVYAPKWVYGDSLAGLGFPLWASSYVTGAGGFRALYPGDGSSRWGAYSGQTPAILQYSSSAVIGGQSTSDANAYRGTLAQLQSLVAPGWSDDMPLTPDDAQLVVNTLLDEVIDNFPYDPANPQRKVRDLLRYIQSRDITAAAVDAKLAPRFAAAVDEQALVAALVPAIVAALPSGVTVTEEQLQAAFVAALQQMAAPKP